MEARHVSIYIARAPSDVYEFASDPRNLPRWAAGLARSEVTREGDAWIAEAPFGRVTIRVAPKNAFGVMDHDVELESGLSVHNPMRVMPNCDGSEFVFTLFRRPEMSDEEYAADRRAVEQDLRTLKAVLERRTGCLTPRSDRPPPTARSASASRPWARRSRRASTVARQLDGDFVECARR